MNIMWLTFYKIQIQLKNLFKMFVIYFASNPKYKIKKTIDR